MPVDNAPSPKTMLHIFLHELFCSRSLLKHLCNVFLGQVAIDDDKMRLCDYAENLPCSTFLHKCLLHIFGFYSFLLIIC